jgi:3-methyladenine DNA glycosylase AlkD
MDFLPDPIILANEMMAEINNLAEPSTKRIRTIRRIYSKKLITSNPEYVLRFARILCFDFGQRWLAYETIADNEPAFHTLGADEIETFGQGIDSWWTVDSFARTISGPAWLKGQIADGVIHRWASSPDVWWRRAALVSTVALNLRSKGGKGNVNKTLVVCKLLVADHAVMITKALSWALRELVIHDPGAVQNFLDQNEHILAAIVKREVKNKLNTGLKTPKRKGKYSIPVTNQIKT